jgi:hypothetical protein
MLIVMAFSIGIQILIRGTRIIVNTGTVGIHVLIRATRDSLIAITIVYTTSICCSIGSSRACGLFSAVSISGYECSGRASATRAIFRNNNRATRTSLITAGFILVRSRRGTCDNPIRDTSRTIPFKSRVA